MEFLINPESKIVKNMSMRTKASKEFNLFNILGDHNFSDFLMNLCI
jgi:hypothetical protein